MDLFSPTQPAHGWSSTLHTARSLSGLSRACASLSSPAAPASLRLTPTQQRVAASECVWDSRWVAPLQAGLHSRVHCAHGRSSESRTHALHHNALGVAKFTSTESAAEAQNLPPPPFHLANPAHCQLPPHPPAHASPPAVIATTPAPHDTAGRFYHRPRKSRSGRRRHPLAVWSEARLLRQRFQLCHHRPHAGRPAPLRPPPPTCAST